MLFADRDNAGTWLQYHANHFFDKDYATEHLRIWDIAPLDRAALHRINSCNLSEKVAMSPLYKTITAIGTPDTLKSGICRAEYDMRPTMQNFAAFVDSKEHDPLLLSYRNRRIMQLLHIAEHGDLPGDFNGLHWVGTKLYQLSADGLKDRFTKQDAKEIASTVLAKLYPDIRTMQQKQTVSLKRDIEPPYLKQTGGDTAAGKPRAVPSIPQQERTKRAQTF